MRRNAMDAKDWISVKDRLPSDSFPKLFYNDITNTYGICCFKEGKFIRIVSRNQKYIMDDCAVTHWFDIPQPPLKKIIA